MQIYECHALSKALDTEKKIADQMLNVAHLAKQGIKNEPTKGHDSEVSLISNQLANQNRTCSKLILAKILKRVFFHYLSSLLILSLIYSPTTTSSGLNI